MITFGANPATQNILVRTQPKTTITKPVEKPIADIEDFKSVDQVCLSCPSKGDKALPVSSTPTKKHKGIVRKPNQ